MTTLNRNAYRQLIDEDLAWLKQKTRTLERDHIEQIIEWSIRVLYDGEPADAFAPRPEAKGDKPCLICCPTEEIPESIRAFVLELRAEYPSHACQHAPVELGLRICWNCRGTHQVASST